eukprot:gene5432-7183_t
MTPTHRALPRLLAAFASMLLCSQAAWSQSWEYRSYRKGSTGQYDAARFVPGSISIEEKDGQWRFRMNAGTLDICYRGDLPAMVTKTDDLTTIEVQQTVPGCESFRYTIRNDGSGGIKEIQQGDRWLKSRLDHGLTPLK